MSRAWWVYSFLIMMVSCITFIVDFWRKVDQKLSQCIEKKILWKWEKGYKKKGQNLRNPVIDRM